MVLTVFANTHALYDPHTHTALYTHTHTPQCVRIGQHEYLRQDLALRCWGPEHRAFVPIALLLMVLFAFGLPLLLWWLLFRERHDLQSVAVQQRIGFLYARCRFSCFCAGALYRFLFSMVLTVFANTHVLYGPHTHTAHTHTHTPQCKKAPSTMRFTRCAASWS